MIKFNDGSEIIYNNQSDIFGNTLIGTFHHQLVGRITFTDKKNGLTGIVEPLKQKGRSIDYITGYITD